MLSDETGIQRRLFVVVSVTSEDHEVSEHPIVSVVFLLFLTSDGASGRYYR